MSEGKQSKHGNERQKHDSAQHDQLPYWKRMHKDWRFWVGVFFMVAGPSRSFPASFSTLLKD
jgi:hypothetical protein